MVRILSKLLVWYDGSFFEKLSFRLFSLQSDRFPIVLNSCLPFHVSVHQNFNDRFGNMPELFFDVLLMD